MTKVEKALGPGATGEVGEDPITDQSTIQPGLLETDEKAGATPEEQAAALQKQAAKDEKEKTTNGG